MHWLSGAAVGTVMARGNGEGDPRDQLNCPSGVAVAPDGGILVVDAGNFRVMHGSMRRTDEAQHGAQ